MNAAVLKQEWRTPRIIELSMTPGAIANRNYRQKHHDEYYARQRMYNKSPDVREYHRLRHQHLRLVSPEFSDAERAASRKWARKDMLRRYNLSEDMFVDLLLQQNKSCAICLAPFDLLSSNRQNKMRVPHVDHDHITGRVRGLLCSKCNTAIIGLLNDDVKIIRQAVNYLTSQHGGEGSSIVGISVEGVAWQ